MLYERKKRANVVYLILYDKNSIVNMSQSLASPPGNLFHGNLDNKAIVVEIPLLSMLQVARFSDTVYANGYFMKSAYDVRCFSLLIVDE